MLVEKIVFAQDASPEDISPDITPQHVAEALFPGLRNRKIVQQTETACMYQAFGYTGLLLPNARLHLRRNGQDDSFIRVVYMKFEFSDQLLILAAEEAYREELENNDNGEIE